MEKTLEQIFKECGFHTEADIKEVEKFVDDLYLQCNSQSFEELWIKIYNLKLNGEQKC